VRMDGLDPKMNSFVSPPPVVVRRNLYTQMSNNSKRKESIIVGGVVGEGKEREFKVGLSRDCVEDKKTHGRIY